jgi:hypothetical protein
MVFTLGALVGGLLIFGAFHHSLYKKLEAGDIAFTNRHNAIYKIDISHNENPSNQEYTNTQRYDELGNLIASATR